MIHDSILGTIGNTPVVRINRLAPQGVDDLRQVRGLQPALLGQGPARDRDHRGRRAARHAQAGPDGHRGDLGKHRDRARDGLRGEGLSVRRDHVRQLLGRAPQAHAHPRREGRSSRPPPSAAAGMVKKAEELAKKNGWFLARQFENQANPEYHRNTTGPEILRDFAGKRLDYWVTGYGTGGTLTGRGRHAEDGAPRRRRSSSPSPRARRCSPGREWKPHKIQGWTPDFVPAVLDRKVYDEIVTVTDVEARDAARDLAAEGRDLLRHLLRRHVRGREEGRREGAEGLRRSSRCCPTPASATSRRSSSRGSTRGPTRSRPGCRRTNSREAPPDGGASLRVLVLTTGQYLSLGRSGGDVAR